MRGEDPLELDERLLVEADEVEIIHEDPALGQAVLDRMARKALVVLLAREALLRRGGDDPAVAHQAGRRIVIEARDAQDVHARLRPTSTK